jgi:DNA-binding transcriptional LysR family regulator
LNRAQSAITYGIRKLEAQFGLPLFDRVVYRPELTEAGRTLLVRARRVAEEANAFGDTAHSLASGLEAELTIVLDSVFPMPVAVEALRAFTPERFPTVQPRIYVQPLGAAVELLRDGTAMIGLVPLLQRCLAAEAFSADDHRAGTGGRARSSTGRDRRADRHNWTGMSNTDLSAVTAGRDYGVLSSRTWRLADLGAERSMLLAGQGGGNMPAHLVGGRVPGPLWKSSRARARPYAVHRIRANSSELDPRAHTSGFGGCAGVTQVAHRLGVSPATLYRYIPAPRTACGADC